MAKKKHNLDFSTSTIRVIKSNTYHTFSVKLAEDIGLAKACILANINDSADLTFEGLRKHFSYIPWERLYELINELISEGHLTLGDSNE